ncbi:hypothetical protein BAU01nite_18790 [Brevibacterium aurantiacum]|nr:hypothetical protein BAU01nite_18790 [Brevibacterium aurantiacum]
MWRAGSVTQFHIGTGCTGDRKVRPSIEGTIGVPEKTGIPVQRALGT